MRYLSVLADDLTGAADTAARCRHFGLQATIFLDIPEPPLPPGGALAFTSDSRHLPAAAAGRQARAGRSIVARPGRPLVQEDRLDPARPYR